MPLIKYSDLRHRMDHTGYLLYMHVPEALCTADVSFMKAKLIVDTTGSVRWMYPLPKIRAQILCVVKLGIDFRNRVTDLFILPSLALKTHVRQKQGRACVGCL